MSQRDADLAGRLETQEVKCYLPGVASITCGPNQGLPRDHVGATCDESQGRRCPVEHTVSQNSSMGFVFILIFLYCGKIHSMGFYSPRKVTSRFQETNFKK